MTGTLAVALAKRKVPTQPDKLSSDVEGIIEKADGHIVISKIVVRYHIKVPQGKRADAEQAMQNHEKGCPASQSVQRGIAIEYSGTIEEE